jgi:hypothetical protein
MAHDRHRAFALAALTLLALAACGDSATEVRTFPITVRVEYPASYGQSIAAGARVILASTERSTADTATTDASGAATFSRVVPGTYQVSASRALTADEAFALTGQRTAAQLNAAATAQPLLSAPATPLTLRLAGTPLGGLVIKEVYYAGSPTPSGGTYFSDQFVEVYNNSTDTLYLDSLIVADVYGPSGQINPGQTPTPFKSDQANVYVSSAWMIPGTGKQRPLAPGQSVVIAQDGIDHKGDPNGNPASPVDLSTAEWETYNQRDDNRDIDAPSVPNLVRLYHTGGFDWSVPVFGPALVIFRTPTFAALEVVPVPGTSASFPPKVKVPVASVLDAFEALQNGESAGYKRIAPALDAGFVFASGIYTKQSARRKTTATIAGRRVLQDTNNSTNDFEIITVPTPRGFATVATVAAWFPSGR